MEIILLERVEKLGHIGDVVTVKDGYARNFLLPNKKALRSNNANRKVFDANRAKIEADNANRRGDAETHAALVEGKQIILIRAASQTGQLYGSVSVRDITTCCVVAFDLRTVRFENLAVCGVGTKCFLVGKQEVTGIAVLHHNNVANGAEFFDPFEQNDFHVFAPYFTT